MIGRRISRAAEEIDRGMMWQSGLVVDLMSNWKRQREDLDCAFMLIQGARKLLLLTRKPQI